MHVLGCRTCAEGAVCVLSLSHYRPFDRLRERVVPSTGSWGWDIIDHMTEAHDLRSTSAGGEIIVRMLHRAEQMRAAEGLLSRVWGGDTVQLDAATMQALAHTGNYVSGAFNGDELVGCAVGFFAPPAERSLHSHIAGVHPRFAGRGIGTLLKNHQRDWCLAQGVTSMTWTYDPAIARNAYFNITKLGVSVLAYFEDFYGPLDDGLNDGSPSDRLLVRWDLERIVGATVAEVDSRPFALTVDPDGVPAAQPVDAAATAVLVQLPTDVERLRRDDPARAALWRATLRDVLGGYLADDSWQVTGFRKAGHLVPASYVVERT